ncbi:hypothetical protein [Amycolatopsis thermophila]|uniref:Uncharacterized protein n=1 Tax=Amycolatopsis thermophila TaxID=206084 RepID=A0ABU0F2S8_9PSEU|nr:hypothetical protein [Amycolatopsis thermophila]MDQ0381471.1 hypothetical protein [Amycolatopsis thermophila]
MTDTTLRADELANLFGSSAANWLLLGLTVSLGTPADRQATGEVTVRLGDSVVGFTEPSTEFPGRRLFRAVITDDHPGVPFPAGFLPPDPLQARHTERLRWLPAEHPDRPAEGTIRRTSNPQQ